MYAHPGYVTDDVAGRETERAGKEEGGGGREEINVGRQAGKPGGGKGHYCEPCFCLIANNCEEARPWL